MSHLLEILTRWISRFLKLGLLRKIINIGQIQSFPHKNVETLHLFPHKNVDISQLFPHKNGGHSYN